MLVMRVDSSYLIVMRVMRVDMLVMGVDTQCNVYSGGVAVVIFTFLVNDGLQDMARVGWLRYH